MLTLAKKGWWLISSAKVHKVLEETFLIAAGVKTELFR